MTTPDQPTGMNELRERLEERIYAELVADNLNSTLRTENIMLYVDDYLAGIQQLVGRCLPARDTRKHACPGADEHIQIGYNAAIDQVRRNLQQAGLLRGDELTQKPPEETEGQ